jgi:hypothetical protein
VLRARQAELMKRPMTNDDIAMFADIEAPKKRGLYKKCGSDKSI